jgi:hypothetical protein
VPRGPQSSPDREMTRVAPNRKCASGNHHRCPVPRAASQTRSKASRTWSVARGLIAFSMGWHQFPVRDRRTATHAHEGRGISTTPTPGITDRCPRCGSPSLARILYGLPAFTRRLEEDLDAGRVVLGGCVIGEDPPDSELRRLRDRHPAGRAHNGRRRLALRTDGPDSASKAVMHTRFTSPSIALTGTDDELKHRLGDSRFATPSVKCFGRAKSHA